MRLKVLELLLAFSNSLSASSVKQFRIECHQWLGNLHRLAKNNINRVFLLFENIIFAGKLSGPNKNRVELLFSFKEHLQFLRRYDYAPITSNLSN